MPELPDVVVYVERLAARAAGRTLQRFRLRSPFVLRTVDPPPEAIEGRTVRDVRRLGKRIVLALDDDLFVVVHLMIAGRLRWGDRGAKVPGKLGRFTWCAAARRSPASTPAAWRFSTPTRPRSPIGCAVRTTRSSAR